MCGRQRLIVWSECKKCNSAVYGSSRNRDASHHSLAKPSLPIRGKDAQEPKATLARAYPSFLSMKHAYESCYSPLDRMLGHWSVPSPPPAVCSQYPFTHLAKEMPSGQSFLSKKTTQWARIESWTSRSWVWVVNRLATHAPIDDDKSLVCS